MATPFPYYESDLSAYSSIQDAPYFIHEGRRMIPDLYDEAPEPNYQADVRFSLEFEAD